MIPKHTCSPVFVAALYTTAKIWKQPKCQGVNKEDMVHIHNGILLSHKRKDIMAFAATWMDLEIIMLSGVSQTMRHQHQML